MNIYHGFQKAVHAERGGTRRMTATQDRQEVIAAFKRKLKTDKDLRARFFKNPMRALLDAGIVTTAAEEMEVKRLVEDAHNKVFRNYLMQIWDDPDKDPYINGG